MRVLVAFALLALGVLLAAPAHAADVAPPNGFTAIGNRAAPLVVYDYQPGVIVRAYWLAPWRKRHFFPTTGQTPIAGRDEDLSASARETPEPAESFYRVWSTSSAFSHEEPRANAPSPRAEQIPQGGDAVKP